uniref:alpha/beta hydrolase n=1 Tax=Thaumasiovibrio occultus TaxID=1891184 RepID=UPI000B3536A2|nr:alpha/beta fold hydrolase [Thaumasiovibrio occultus]
MSSKIYFEQGGSKWQKLLVGAVSGLHRRMAPGHAKKVARRLFLTPVRYNKVIPQPEGMTERSLNTSEGRVKVYEVGMGPTILLAHGWSGAASQFFPLMTFLAENGYHAVAFDHAAHGNSEGKMASLPAFINVTEAVIDDIGEIVGLISHSMGTASSLESRHAYAEQVPQLLVAPALKYVEGMINAVKRFGYSMTTFRRVVDDISTQYCVPVEQIDPMRRAEQRQAPTWIIHDRGDRFANFDDSQEAAAFAQVEFLATEGLGHGRILSSDELMGFTERWLAETVKVRS